MKLPFIDTRVRHVGISVLRKLNDASLRALDGVLVLSKHDHPLAVLVPYETFIRMQNTSLSKGSLLNKREIDAYEEHCDFCESCALFEQGDSTAVRCQTGKQLLRLSSHD